MVLTSICSLVLVLMTLAGTNRAVAQFSTTSIPEPTYMGMAIVVLPLESKATVTLQCWAFQIGALRNTLWYIQRVGEEIEHLIDMGDSNSFAMITGDTRYNATLIKFTQDLHRAVILCGPNDGEVDRRFLLTFPGI